jgi:putative ABC transport system permease protein
VTARLAAQLWPDESPIGRRLRVGENGAWRTVVGVVPDTRKPPAAPARPDVYVPYAQAPRSFVGILARTQGDPAALAPGIGRALGRVSPLLALSGVEPMETVVAREGARPRALAAILGGFALFALALAALGLYSSLSYVVAHRARELAVRVAVGADARAIIRLVFGEGVPTVVVGLALGTAAGLTGSRVLASQLYGVSATDPGTISAIAILVAATALAAFAAPAWRAARVDPSLALRGE